MSFTITKFEIFYPQYVVCGHSHTDTAIIGMIDMLLFEQTQLEGRRRRIETENTVPIVADTQNATKTSVDKNCNATAVEHNHPSKYTETFKFAESKWILVIYTQAKKLK